VSPEDVVARLAVVLPAAAITSAHGAVTADVDRDGWVAAVTAVRDDPGLDGTFLDLLTAVDQSPGGFDVVVRLWSVAGRHGVHLRTTSPREDARVPSLTTVFAGAAWHEREIAEMFGLTVEGHPDLRPLLLPDSGVAHPLRKDHVLAARVQTPWPGAVDPADSGEGGRPSKRRLLPPGAT